MPPRSRMKSPAAASSSSVVMPGRSSEPTWAIVSATSTPAAAIFSISRSLLRMIIGSPRPPRARPGSPRTRRPSVCSPSTVDLGAHAPVALDHQLGELVVEAQPVPDRLGRVVDASLLDRPRCGAAPSRPRRRPEAGSRRRAACRSPRASCRALRPAPSSAGSRPARTRPRRRGARGSDSTVSSSGTRPPLLEDRAHLHAELRARPRRRRARCRRSRREERRTPRRSAWPESPCRSPVGRE